MARHADLHEFIDKWLARWPEWRVAEAFLPARSRESLLAWASLRQELADAAWAGVDPRPGEAKLAWWAEELHGWARTESDELHAWFARERITFERQGADRFRATYEMSRDGGVTWRSGDVQTFQRTAVSADARAA